MKDVKNMKFEAAMARLEEVVAMLEAGKATLDEALAAYEEGMALVRLCHERLNDAEARILLVRDGEEGVTAEPVGGAEI